MSALEEPCPHAKVDPKLHTSRRCDITKKSCKIYWTIRAKTCTIPNSKRGLDLFPQFQKKGDDVDEPEETNP